MVALGNFQVKKTSQQKSTITFDTFTDTNTLKAFNRTSATRIYESFLEWNKFKWSKDYILGKFSTAETNKNYADYLVFLLQEELYTLTETRRVFGVEPSSANGNAYDIRTLNDNYYLGTIPKMPDAGEASYLLELLKAWHTLCNHLNKKSAIIGCPAGYEPNIQHVFEEVYTVNGLKYIRDNYDMVYIYKFPTTGKATTFGYRAKEPLNYWRNTLGYNGKINYLLDTYFGSYNGIDVGSKEYNTVKEDFRNAAENGADIISCYPSVNKLTNDSLATDRLIKIYNELYPNNCSPISCNFVIN